MYKDNWNDFSNRINRTWKEIRLMYRLSHLNDTEFNHKIMNTKIALRMPRKQS